MLQKIGQEAQEASKTLASASESQKNQALQLMSESLMKHCDLILDANKRDLEKGKGIGISVALTDRLTLTSERVQSMADGLQKIVELEVPTGNPLVIEFDNNLNIQNYYYLDKTRAKNIIFNQ